VGDATKVPRRLVIIDAANCLYRAFFGIPPLRAADGFPTNAVFGFAKMLAKVIREEEPDAVAVVFDPPGGSFRDEIYPDSRPSFPWPGSWWKRTGFPSSRSPASRPMT
jgi:DNA polymerase-1